MTIPRSIQVPVLRVRDGAGHEDVDYVAAEEPLEIRLGYGPAELREQRPISITMRTPGDDIELALGFLYTEGIIDDMTAVVHAAPCGDPAPGTDLRNAVRVELAPEISVDTDRLQRHFYTTSSCGVCGKASLDALRVYRPRRPADSAFSIPAQTLCALPAALQREQGIFARTGGLHASAAFDPAGNVERVREDVGRHNALDKLVGTLLSESRLPAAGRGVLVSGRASFELLQKAMMAGFDMLAAVGAPSSLAVELAEEFGITLVGFLRDGRFNVYAHPERVERSD